jgi:hypothetical protein
MKVRYRNQKTPGFHAQAIVEFALVLPILMMLLVGVLEAGRMIYTYAAVNNASREAARFGSALGYDDEGYHKYKHCEGIRKMARRSAYFTPLTIAITYDRGPAYALTPFAWCDAASGEDNDFTLTTNDRVKVTVTAHYKPLINLIPFPERDFTSISARSILGFVEVGESPSSGSGSGSGNTPTATSPATAVPSSTSTATGIPPSNTPTSTLPPGVATLTPFDTYTPTLTPTETLTPTITFTPTMTITPTMTFTPTVTSTPVPGCDQITAGPINIIKGYSTMTLSITNPHDAITIQNVLVTWNSLTGGPGKNTPLRLTTASLGGVFWTGSDSSGSLTIWPTTTVTIPGNNATSTLIFTFDNNYQNRLTNDSESITINLSTPGCESYPIHRP